jgi:hypothetical protein
MRETKAENTNQRMLLPEPAIESRDGQEVFMW